MVANEHLDIAKMRADYGLARQPFDDAKPSLQLSTLKREPQENQDTQPDKEPEPFNYKDSQSFGSYLFGANYADPALQGKGAPNENWTSHTKSRIMVRLFSRGLMGAAFYSVANRWAPGQLSGYSATGAINPEKPLQYLARGFDIAYGKPIQAYVKTYHKLAGKSAEEAAELARNATTFRRTRKFGTEEDGRSLGAEIVVMTTDFAAGSTGDAWGRNIANILDPNTRNSWEDEKDGHIHWGEFAKANARAAWRIFSKNQGEDWAVALPYVYQMKWQRNAINRLYPGFAISSDHSLNGGSWRINQHGEMVESYAKAGALDLQARFTGYNWYTLMYRELYENVSDRIKHFRQTGEFSSRETETGQDGLLDNTAHAFRYVTKSAIKAFIYMTPAVPFFWVTRTPQTKTHGLAVLVDSHTGEVHSQPFPKKFDPFLKENTRGVFDRALSPFGKACFETSEMLNKGIKALHLAPAAKTTYVYTKPTFAETFANSSLSYTPYMIAKAETALRWDRVKGADGLNGMDRAIYRFLDGGMRLNLGEVMGGLSDMRREITHPPSNREIHAKRRADMERYHSELQRQKKEDESKEATPDTKVSDAKEVSGKQEAADIAPENWREAMQAEFAKSPYPDKGVTIH